MSSATAATTDELSDDIDLTTGARPQPLTLTRGVSAWLGHNRIDVCDVTTQLSPTKAATDSHSHCWYRNSDFDVLVDEAEWVVLRVMARKHRTTSAPDPAPRRYRPGVVAEKYVPGDLTTLTPTKGVRRHAEVTGINIDRVLRDLDAPTTTRVNADVPTPEDPEPATIFHTEWCTLAANLYTGVILRITAHSTPRTELTEQLIEHATATARDLDAAKRARAAERAACPDSDPDPTSSIDRLPAPQTIDDLVDRLEERGCQIVLRRSGHYAITHPGTPGVHVTTGSTPSDHRSLLNTVSDIRSVLGIDVRLPAE